MVSCRYYRLFMYYYKLSLRTANFTMVNSSWTKNHVDFILRYTDPLIEALHYLPPFVLVRLLVRQKPLRDVNIVYPPCDTRAMAGFALSGRERVVLSIAQFRCA
jgi:alpha-1,2-mannosyltransferase